MKNLSAKDTLNRMIDILLVYLEDLKTVDGQFVSGERTAFAECLEMLQYWEGAAKCGLDFDVEAKFKI